MIKIGADALSQFIVKTTCGGKIESCKLDFQDKGLVMQHKDENGIIAIFGVLDKVNFSAYEVMQLNIVDSATLIKSLDTFGKNLINIVKEGNMVKILDENGGFDIALAEKVDNHLENIPGLQYDNTLLVQKTAIAAIKKKNDIINSDEIVVQNSKKTLSFTVGKEVNKASQTIPTNLDSLKSASFDFKYFYGLVSNMELVFDMSLDENLPSKFFERTDKFVVTYFLTPQSKEN